LFSWLASGGEPTSTIAAPSALIFLDHQSGAASDRTVLAADAIGVGIAPPPEPPAIAATSGLVRRSPAGTASAFNWRQTAMLALWLWAIGAVTVVAGISRVWWKQQAQLRRTSRPARGDLAHACERLARRLGLRRRVRLVVSTTNDGPFAFGIFQPTIVLPQRLEQAAAPELYPLLLHELVHVRRGDTLVAAMQMFAVAIWWFHPLVWLVSRALSRQRELCCDDEVLAGADCDPDSYAQCLLNVLRERRRPLSAILVTGVRPVDVTRDRLEMIMNARRKRFARMPWFGWAALVVGAAVIVPGRGLRMIESEANAAQPVQPAASPPAAAPQEPATRGTRERMQDAPQQTSQPYEAPTRPGGPLPENQRVNFGPVVELTVDNDIPGRNFLLDLDAGKVFAPPADFRPGSAKEFHDWCAKQGVDAMGEGGYLLGQDIIVLPTAEFNWNPSRNILNQVEDGKPGSPVPIVPLERLPSTYFFKTREGGVGVLQIIAAGGSTRIRFKLVQKADNAAAAPAGAARVAVPEQNPRVVEENVRKLIAQFVEASKKGRAADVKPLIVEGPGSPDRHLHYLEDTQQLLAENVDPGNIATVVIGFNSALAISDFYESTAGAGDARGKYCTLYTCVLHDGKWLINDIDLEPVEGLVQEVSRFVEGIAKQQTVPPR
jgi:beta-lactamase regulating signal transducer with metallopeptidase domain